MNKASQLNKNTVWEGFLHQLSHSDISHDQQTAIDTLLTHALPTRREEAWKYSDLQWLRNYSFASNQQKDITFSKKLLNELLTEEIRFLPRIVTVNGIFEPELSFNLQHESYNFHYHHCYGKLANPQKDVMTALNFAMGQKAISLTIPADQKKETIVIINLGCNQENEIISFHPKYFVHLESKAQLSVIEINYGNGKYFSNPVYEFQLADQANLNYTQINNASSDSYHFSNTYINLADHAHYQQFLITTGTIFARQELLTQLEGEWSQTEFDAIQILNNKQHADITTQMIHKVPHCKSKQNVKNILSDHSHGVFQGKVFVDRLAQKTDAQQQNQALLLSDHAEINTKPELEIYADDVKCSHGAAIGALDQEQLFFLMSRGIPYELARQMLINAFITESVEKIKDPIIQSLLKQHLNF